MTVMESGDLLEVFERYLEASDIEHDRLSDDSLITPAPGFLVQDAMRIVQGDEDECLILGIQISPSDFGYAELSALLQRLNSCLTGEVEAGEEGIFWAMPVAPPQNQEAYEEILELASRDLVLIEMFMLLYDAWGDRYTFEEHLLKCMQPVIGYC
ncbi:MAG: hypothetical protein ABA06_03295 [Parcubacteria bacterium C7867-001]|nr:MAG: hypothetical protein ABA06_03295 [Parcubacteria bacterium C7867-001]